MPSVVNDFFTRSVVGTSLVFDLRNTAGVAPSVPKRLGEVLLLTLTEAPLDKPFKVAIKATEVSEAANANTNHWASEATPMDVSRASSLLIEMQEEKLRLEQAQKSNRAMVWAFALLLIFALLLVKVVYGLE